MFVLYAVLRINLLADFFFIKKVVSGCTARTSMYLLLPVDYNKRTQKTVTAPKLTNCKFCGREKKTGRERMTRSLAALSPTDIVTEKRTEHQLNACTGFVEHIPVHRRPANERELGFPLP